MAKKNTPTFGMLFSTLSTAVNMSADQARSQLKASLQARVARLELIRAHIKNKGALTASQKKKLSLPELAFVKAVETGEDPDVKKAAAEIERMATEGVATIKDGLKTLWDKISK